MALFNWLFARHHGGTYVVRVEDTDYDRCRDEYTEAIFRTLDWCGLSSDEPVVYQSQRSALYHAEIDRLLASGAAYRCYCSQEEMQRRVRQVASDGHEYFVYDGYCRTRTDKPAGSFVVRLAVPRNDRELVTVNDICRGTLSFPISAIDDFVLVRSDGSAMYNCTVVVDDAHMNITHIIRGDDHIVNTPRQVLLYEAFGFAVPQLAHIPLILGADGTKLSKRDAAVSVDAYREMGFLPEALCNYLVRLGWADGDQEIIDQKSLIAIFRLEDVGRKGAQFDYEKLLWMNSMYMKMLSPDALLNRLLSDLTFDAARELSLFSGAQRATAVALYQGRSKTLVELRDHLMRLGSGGTREGMPEINANQRAALQAFVDELSNAQALTADAVTVSIKELVKRMHLGFADLAVPLRWALAGSLAAPAVGDLVALCGVDLVRERVLRLLA